MNRVETAIREGRCVLVFGSRVLQDADTLAELRRRPSLPAVVLSGAAPSPAVQLGADALAAATAHEGGVLVLIEADGVDGQGLTLLGNLVAAAPHKPRLVVAARAFNPFLLPTPLRLLKFEHEKRKAREFLALLPTDAPAAAPVAGTAAPVEEKKKTSGAPKLQFVGRAEELGQLREFLGVGGPVAIVGPMGIGRHWLLDHALKDGTFKRLPDFHVGWGSEADSLFARIAAFGKELGDHRLGELLREPARRPSPAAMAALAVETLANEAAAGHVMVIDRLEHVLRRDGTFHREGRFELLLRALLVGTYACRVVFLSTVRPRFYKEGEGAALRVMELGGLKGRELHELFDAYRVEDFPREHFGDIHNRIHGHPFAARMFAVAVRNPEDRDELLENRRFMQMDGPADLEPVKRRIRKAVEGLTDEERGALGALAHFRGYFTVADAEALVVDRKIRIALLSAGLLDMGANDQVDRTFRVHPLVHSVLDARATSDFRVLETLGNATLAKAAKAHGLEQLALQQEGNRLLFEAHRVRNRARMPYPDHDPTLESVRGLVRGRAPRFDLAEQRLNEALRADPANPELLLMKAELLIARKDPPEKVAEVYAEAERLAPTPEVFHHEASWHQLKSSGRGRAAATLERAAQVFPESGRIRRRLAGIYVDQNRLDDAVRVLQEAMALEPMMPDTYGLLGEIYLMLGPSHYDQAEEALGEARRLDPENGLHMARLGALIYERGIDDEARRNLAKELLEQAVQVDGKNYLAHLYLARVLVQGGGDLEQADYLLKKASKLDERAAIPLVERALIAIERKQWAEAEPLIEKAIRMEPACHEAFFARGEMFARQGFIFNARPEYQRALERSPRDSRSRARYQAAIATCDGLIESGVALELQKQAEAEGMSIPQPRAQPDGQRRDPGKTTRRRRGGKEVAPDAHDSAPAEGAAEPTGSANEPTGVAAEGPAEPAEVGSEAPDEPAAPAEARPENEPPR